MIDELTEKKAHESRSDFFERACDIIVAFLSKNDVAPADVSAVIRNIHSTLDDLFVKGDGAATSLRNAPVQHTNLVPAVSISESVKPEYIVCLEDGKHLKTLKRYIAGRFGLTPEEYRRKWSLPTDYPMVAPNYSEKRARLAKKFRLGKVQKGSRKAK